jgi:hypothetical protein
MTGACSKSRHATLDRRDERWRELRPPAWFRHWPGSPGHSATAHKAFAGPQFAPKSSARHEALARGLRRTRTARSSDVVSRPDDVLQKEGSTSTPLLTGTSGAGLVPKWARRQVSCLQRNMRADLDLDLVFLRRLADCFHTRENSLPGWAPLSLAAGLE